MHEQNIANYDVFAVLFSDDAVEWKMNSWQVTVMFSWFHDCSFKQGLTNNYTMSFSILIISKLIIKMLWWQPENCTFLPGGVRFRTVLNIQLVKQGICIRKVVYIAGVFFQQIPITCFNSKLIAAFIFRIVCMPFYPVKCYAVLPVNPEKPDP